MALDINEDPEVWEFTDRFGDRALRTVAQVFANIEKTENRWKLSGDWLGSLSRLTRQRVATVRLEVLHMVANEWLVAEEVAADGLPTVLSARNYWKFHKRQEPKSAENETPSVPNKGTLLPSFLPVLPKNHKNDSSSMELEKSAPAPWPQEWLWLKEFILKQTWGLPIERFLDFAWWDAVSYSCGGLSLSFIETEFAKIRRWIMDNKKREPTPKGYRKFVAGWLERAHEKERRFKHG